MRVLFLSFAVLLLTSCGLSKPKSHHQIVFQMTSGIVEEQKGLINNLENILEVWGDKTELEVVAHGPGLSMLVETSTPVSEKIKTLISKGVVFVACENTMKRKNVTYDELVQGVQTVPMGIGEIVKKQEQGWSYIKANF